jgi:hypothetical protein
MEWMDGMDGWNGWMEWMVCRDHTLEYGRVFTAVVIGAVVAFS